MNKRERILTIVIGILGVAFVGRVVVKGYLSALDDARSDVRQAERKLEDAEKAAREYQERREYWSHVGKQTLTQDAATIGNLLREDLLRMSREAGLQQAEIDPGGVRSPNERKPVGTAHPKVRAEGRMENMLKFLYLVQTQPYYVRCSKMTLTPEEIRDRRTGKRSTTGKMSLILDLETLVLWDSRKYPPVEPDPDNDLGPERLVYAELDPYLQQISPNLFAVWVPPPEKATIIDPPNNGQPFEGYVTLKWRPGPRATKHIIRVGEEDPPPVVASQPANPEQPAAEYRIPEQLAAGETRYWRIDQEGEGGITEGDVVKFTTRPQPPPGKAIPVSPPNNGQIVEGRVVLRWRPGAHANQHVVHWGRESPPTQVATQAGAEYAIPETLEAGLTIYWRVDQIGPGGTTEGDVWTFTTTPKVEPERVVHGDRMVGRVLSWPGSQQVVLEKAGSQSSDDDIRVEVGDEFFKGVLVLVHPEGAVSQQMMPDGRTRLYFHAIGAPVQQAQPLSPETHPRIYHEVEQLRQRAEGITQRPG